MSEAIFPTMLKHRATILGSLTRLDLILLGSSYLVLSYFKASGITMLIVSALLYFGAREVEKRVPHKFINFLNSPKNLSWNIKLGGKNE
jgi:hypothetical protein